MTKIIKLTKAQRELGLAIGAMKPGDIYQNEAARNKWYNLCTCAAEVVARTGNEAQDRALGAEFFELCGVPT